MASVVPRLVMSFFVNKRFVKYCLVGVVTNGVGYSIFYFAVLIRSNLYFAMALSYVVACLIATFLNAHVTFAERTKRTDTYIKYFSQHVTLLVLNMLLMNVFVTYFKMNVYLSQVVCTFSIALIGFTTNVMIVFSRPMTEAITDKKSDQP